MSDAVKQVGRDVRQVHTVAPVEVSVSSSTARSAQLGRGQYVITSDADCTFLQGDVTVEALDTSRKLWGRGYRWIYVHGNNAGDDYIAAKTVSGTATLSIEKVDNNPGTVGS